jgi:hypothetical protein
VGDREKMRDHCVAVLERERNRLMLVENNKK